MKKLLAILLSACMLLTLAACSSTGSTAGTASTASDNSTSSTASDASDSSVDKKPGEGTSKVSFSAAARMTMASISVSTNWPRESSLNSASKSF